MARQVFDCYIYRENYKVAPQAKGNFKQIKYHIDKNGCWVCVSHAKGRGGYPVITRYGKYYRMNRYIFENEYGCIDENKHIMHTCDNPECINPKHLMQGTPKENTLDMIRKKRKPVGERVRSAKLNEEQVVEIFKSEGSCIKLAKEHSVSKKTILNIRHGRSWKHLNLLKTKRVPQAEFIETDELSDSERGAGGFGSSGVKA